MYNHLSERRVESTIVPGAAFVIYAPSWARRMAFDLATAEFKTGNRALQRRHNKLMEQIRAAEKSWKSENPELVRELDKLYQRANEMPEPAAQSPDLAEEYSAIHKRSAEIAFRVPRDFQDELDELNENALVLLATKYNAPRLKTYLKAVEGLEINGAPATVDSFVNDGPVQLFHEALEAIETVANVSGEELKNLQLPSISNSRADGKTTDTTATSASESAGIETAIAESTSRVN